MISLILRSKDITTKPRLRSFEQFDTGGSAVHQNSKHNRRIGSDAKVELKIVLHGDPQFPLFA